MVIFTKTDRFFFGFCKKESINCGNVNAPKSSKQNNSLIYGRDSRTPATYKMKTVWVIVNGLLSLNIVSKSAISDVADVLDLLPDSLNIHSFTSTTHSFKHDDHSLYFSGREGHGDSTKMICNFKVLSYRRSLFKWSYIDQIRNTALLLNNQLFTDYRGRSTTPTTSKMKFFMAIVNSLQPLIIFIKCSISYIAEVLNPPSDMATLFNLIKTLK